MKVVIDQHTCIDCCHSYAICPEVFQDDGTGMAELVDEYEGRISYRIYYKMLDMNQ